jgi:hypothetical protein
MLVCDTRFALTHLVYNKLAISTGECELLVECATDPAVVVRLRMIHEAAKAIADEINKPLSRSKSA